MSANPSSLLTDRADSPRRARAVGLRDWIARHPMTAFLVIAASLGYPCMILNALAAHGVVPGGSLPRLLHIAPDEFSGFLLVWAGLVPATLIVTWVTEGRAGVRQLGARMIRWRVGFGWWLLVLAGLPVLTVGLAVLLGDSFTPPVEPVGFLVAQVSLLAVNFLLINLWEETAWAGFLQTRWERRHNLLVASLLTAVVFAFGHLPLGLFDDVTTSSLVVSFLLYLVLGALVRPMFALVLRGTGGSLLLVGLLHSVFNRTNNDNGIAATLVPGQARGLAMLVAVVALTVIVTVAIRRRDRTA
jgi:membrane protease YdiL (CAAX protease family)